MSDELNFWKLCESLSITEAALVIAGINPSDHPASLYNRNTNEQPRSFRPTVQALRGAIELERLMGRTFYHEGSDINGEPYRNFDPSESTVDVEDLRRWLAAKNVRSGFFAAQKDAPQPYMDPSHERYAPKLAAAVAAWVAVGRARGEGKSVKQQLEAWARRHANEFGLCDEDGNPVKAAMDNIAIVANWETKGGAPKTPGERGISEPETSDELVLPQGEERFVGTSGTRAGDYDLDNDIPFRERSSAVEFGRSYTNL